VWSSFRRQRATQGRSAWGDMRSDRRADRRAPLGRREYDRDLAAVFAIQSEIATAMAEQLQAKLSA